MIKRLFDEPAALAPVAVPATLKSFDVEALGKDSVSALSTLSQKMLGTMRTADADKFGEQLSSLLTVAKGLDPNKFGNGLVGRIMSVFSSTKDKLMSQYNTVEQQMDSLIAELDASTSVHRQRIADLEGLFDANHRYHQEIENHIAAGKNFLSQIDDEISKVDKTKSSAADVMFELNDIKDRLDKRVSDLERALLLAKQAAPQIKLLQSNARSLVTKFEDVKAVTIPAWKNAFTLYLVQMEQKKGAALANAIDDATNNAFIMQADMLRQNTNDIAIAKQRGVVDLQTIEHVHGQLMASFDDLTKIEAQGKKEREDARVKMSELEKQLVERFTS